MSDPSGTDKKPATPSEPARPAGGQPAAAPQPGKGRWNPPPLKPDISARHEVKPDDWKPPALQPFTYRTS